MWEEYNDYYEPSGIEQAFNEFIEQAKATAKEELSSQIKKVEEDRNYYYNKNEELAVKERELEKRENELENKKDNIIFDWLKSNGLTLKPNQEVWAITSEITYQKCPRCNGTGKIKVTDANGDELPIDCPDCSYGKKRIETYVATKMYVNSIDVYFTIFKDRNTWDDNDIKIVSTGGHYIDWERYKVRLSKVKNSCLDEKYFNVENIFLTKEDCEKAIKEKIGEKQ